MTIIGAKSGERRGPGGTGSGLNSPGQAEELWAAAEKKRRGGRRSAKLLLPSTYPSTDRDEVQPDKVSGGERWGMGLFNTPALRFTKQDLHLLPSYPPGLMII